MLKEEILSIFHKSLITYRKTEHFPIHVNEVSITLTPKSDKDHKKTNYIPTSLMNTDI